MNESLEERISKELDRLVPLTSQLPNWVEVEQRSLSHSGGHAPGQPVARRVPAGRRLVVVAALLVVALVSTAAYAVVRYAIVGSPAPPPIKVSEQVLNRIKETIISFQLRNVGKVEIAKTRAAAVLATSSGPVYLWVAPTTTGSRCAYLQITGLDARFSGGTPFLMALQPAVCIDTNQRQPLLNIVNTGVDGHTLSVVAGYVPPPARTVQLLFSNGTTTPAVAITGGFVLVQGSRDDPRPTAIIRDGHGHLIGTNAFLRPLFVSTSPVGPSQFTLTLRLRGNLGNLVLRVGPAARGGTCTMLTHRWGGSTSCGPDKTTADEINVFRGLFRNPRPPHQEIVYLKGQVGSSIATVELHYPDGSHKPLPIHHHWVLYQINPNHPPNELIGRNQAGTIIATQRIYL